MELWGIFLTLLFLTAVGFLVYLVLSLVLRGTPGSSMLDYTADPVALRVIQYSTERSRGVETMQSLSSALGGKTVDIYGLNRLALREKEYTDGPNELLFGNPVKPVRTTPFVSSSDAITLDGDNSYAGSYYSALSGNGDAIFLNKTMHQGDASVQWWSNNDSYINDRNAQKCILMEEGGNKGVLVLLPFIYNDKHACVFNYSYQGETSTTTDKGAIASFSACMNWVARFISDNNVVYFIVTGSSALQSIIWRQLVKTAYIDHAYFLSPQAKDNFITVNDSKEGLYTPDFMLIAKSIAPYGVRFGLREPRYITSTQHYALVAEIFKRPTIGRSLGSDFDDVTRLIMRQQVTARLQREPKTTVEASDFALDDYDFSPVAKMVADTTAKSLMPLGIALEAPPNTTPSASR